ncbi:flagellar protein [Streptomyces sp. f150]|uniref:flagellar protein n=1 Tax=Streptomyces sp. f150 TaxID=1827699 RepID=UPI000BEFDA7D|nr:flagellar protein [Streptomyces sp. f150]
MPEKKWRLSITEMAKIGAGAGAFIGFFAVTGGLGPLFGAGAVVTASMGGAAAGAVAGGGLGAGVAALFGKSDDKNIGGSPQQRPGGEEEGRK